MTVRVEEPLRVCVDVPVMDADAEEELDADRDAEPDTEGGGVPPCVLAGVAEASGVPCGEAVTAVAEAVGVGAAVPVDAALRDRVGVCVRGALGVPDAETLLVEDGDADTEDVVDAEDDTEEVGVMEGVCVVVFVLEGVCEAVRVAVGVRDGVGVMDGVMDGVGVGSGTHMVPPLAAQFTVTAMCVVHAGDSNSVDAKEVTPTT